MVTRGWVKMKLGAFVSFVSEDEIDLGQYTPSGKKTYFKRRRTEEKILNTPLSMNTLSIYHPSNCFCTLTQDLDYQLPPQLFAYL